MINAETLLLTALGHLVTIPVGTTLSSLSVTTTMLVLLSMLQMSSCRSEIAGIKNIGCLCVLHLAMNSGSDIRNTEPWKVIMTYHKLCP